MRRPNDHRREPTIVPPDQREMVDFGGPGVHWPIDGPETRGQFSIVHHPIAPRALAAPPHYHTREDEYSHVLEGTLGALLGEHVVEAGPGTWVEVPRRRRRRYVNRRSTRPNGSCISFLVRVLYGPGLSHASDRS